MRPPNRRSRYGGPKNWLQIWSRKSRLRSATKIRPSPRPPLPLETLGRGNPDATSIIVLDSDDDATAPNPPRDDADADADADSDYRGFFDQLNGDTEANPIEIVDNAGDMRADEDVGDRNTDSKYSVFLEQLTVDGDSRVLETVEANPVSVFDDTGDVRPSKREREDGVLETSEVNPVSVFDNAGIERPPKRRREDGDCWDDVDDAEYCLFLSHLIVDGKSYALEMENGDLRMKYEEEEETENCTADGEPDEPDRDVECAEDDGDYSTFLKHVREHNGTMILRLDNNVVVRYSGGESKGGEFKETPVSGMVKNCNAKRRPDNEAVDDDYPVFLKHARVDNGSMILKLDNGTIVRYGEEEEDFEDQNSREARDKTNCEAEHCIDDGDYLMFLKHARVGNGSMILKLGNNVIIRYGEEEGGHKESKKERGLMEEPTARTQEMHIKAEYFEEGSYPYNGETSLQPYNFSTDKDDVCSVVTMSNCSKAVFMDKLNDILWKPFDQNEYDELKWLAARRVPKEKLKVLRSESKAYPTNKLGLSYLDHYPKLAEMIQSADCHDGLVLLRGLFYHLQNVAHDGAFLPWEYASSGYKPLPPGVGHMQLSLPIEISED